MSCNRFCLRSLPNLLLIVFLTQIPIYSASTSKCTNYAQLLGCNLLKSLASDTSKCSTTYPLITDLSAVSNQKTDCSCYPYGYKKAKKKKSKKNANLYYAAALLKALAAAQKPECPKPAPAVTAPCASTKESIQYVPYYVPVPYCCSPSPPPETPPPPPPPTPPPPAIPKIKLSIIESLSPLLPEVETCSCLINPEDLCTSKEIGKPKALLKDKKELLAELLPLIEILKEKIFKPKKPKCYCLCFADNDKCPPGMVSSKKVCLDKIMQTVELVQSDKKNKKKKKKKDKKKDKKCKKLKKKRMSEVDESDEDEE